MDAPDYVLEGERVALGPLRTDLADTYRRWLHDLDVRNGILNPGLYALEAEEAWVEEAIAECAGRYPKQAAFTIYDLADGSPIGTSGLHGIDWRHGRATFGIVIGAGRGRGLGTEATRLTIDWGFHILGLHNVMLTVLPSNAAAIRAYEKAGFKRIGPRRDALVLLGERSDEVLMDVVPGEFESPVLAALR
ncbi:MAG TPA: GNAT family protein [Solirubrobacteraceae bacterium]|nr:GNAT family protein [Solirubrobacteraceae bacterium]